MNTTRIMNYKVDWLAFSLQVKNAQKPLKTAKKVMDFLAYDLDDFQEISGRYFYNSGLTLGNYINIFYNSLDKKISSNTQSSVNVIFTGQGCTDLNDKLVIAYGSNNYEHNWLKLFNYLDKITAKITRFDLALDDFTGVVSFEKIINKLQRGEYRSVKKTYNIVRKADQKGKLQGLTIYIGSNAKGSKGCYYLRMYDKLAQYLDKAQLPPEQVRQSQIWQRYELSFSKEKARKMVRQIQDFGNFGQAYLGVMRNVVEFLVPTKNKSGKKYKNKDKWQVCRWWQSFLGTAEKVKLGDAERDVDLAGMLNWLRVEVVPSLRLLEKLGVEKGFDIYRLIKQCEIGDFSKKQERLYNNALNLPDDLLNLYLSRFKEGYM